MDDLTRLFFGLWLYPYGTVEDGRPVAGSIAMCKVISETCIILCMVDWSCPFCLLKIFISNLWILAKAFGVTDFINPNEINETVQQVIKQMTDGGADYSFECIGDTEMINTALQSCCDGWGVTVTLGVPKTKPEVTAHYGLFLTGRTLKGSLFGGWKPKSDIPSLIDMYLKEEIKIDNLITHNMSFEDINTAFSLMVEGKCLRCVIHMPNE